MRLITFLLSMIIVFLFTGCFEKMGKVEFKTDKTKAIYYVDGKQVDTKKPIELVVGEHKVKAVIPMDKRHNYEGEKNFTIVKDTTIKVAIKTMRVPTKFQKEYINQISLFDPKAYKFKLPPYIKNIDKQKLKEKVDKLLAKKEYGKITSFDIAILGYENIIKELFLKSNFALKTLKGHINTVYSVAVSGDKIISGSEDNSIKIWQPNLELADLNTTNQLYDKAIKVIYDKVKNNSLPIDKLNLIVDRVYKYGKIGEIYVPSVSYTSRTPHYSTTTINGHSYHQTTYSSQTHSSGGYNSSVSGYTAISRIINNNDSYYLVKVKSNWKGKYTKPHTSSSWGGDKSINWSTEYQSGEQISSFLIPPKKYVKYQFEVGEKKADINTNVQSVKVVPKEYAIKLYEALEVKNEAIILIDKFLKDDRVKAWHNRLKRVKKEIIDKQNHEFSNRYKQEVKIKLTLPKEYDADFGGDIVLSVNTPVDMCVKVYTPFGTKTFQLNGKKEFTYKGIKNLSKNPSVYVDKVKMYCK